ncbi:S41 family peptidase [Magnetospirillum molischianum]|uniref:Periplasmic protease n=1 Tax=Magnetospirillum molischianum DSM 120 TaxID=1150626 RepID=H8FW87_MAGML|nr:S41 family peptidase [Magnetospirillum molischianum]CCG42625.1 Periplasmic protease [Magnetospirillum molischianum DSM 120]
MSTLHVYAVVLWGVTRRAGWRCLAVAIVLFMPFSAQAGWDVVEAQRTVAYGLAAIVERHLQQVPASTVALDAMRGLADIDPQFAIAFQGGRVRLSTAERVVADYPAPATDDVESWARLVISVALDAGEVSPLVRDADVERLFRAVFEGALGTADLYSRYAGAAEARDNRASRNGFGGIGIRFELVEGEALIVDVVEDTPAARAGLQADDVIVLIDGKPVRGLERTEISARLRGAVASALIVTLRRAGKIVEAKVQRSLIVPKTVTETLDGPIAIYRISSFNQRTASSLETKLRETRERMGARLKGVVLDLRGNPGGLLDKAVAVADLFIADGPIISTRGRNPAANAVLTARPGDLAEDLPVVVLIDGRSASSAEILASALQDSGRAVVIGTNSYGKGTVQTVIRLPNDGEITLTWSRFHAPSGYALHGLGVFPVLCTSPGQKGTERGGDWGRVARTLDIWRQVGLEETDLRRHLRDLCPPTRRTDAPEDMALALRLLGDSPTFARALAAEAVRAKQ